MSLSFDLTAHHYKNNSNSQYSQITNLLSNINIEKNSYILDVGCGYGKIISTLSQKAHKGISIGIDPSKNMINLALKTFPNDEYKNLKFYQMAAEEVNSGEKCNAFKKMLEASVEKKKDVAMTKYTHLTESERTLIAHYHEQGTPISAIGRLIKRPKTTVWREILRNQNKSGTYNPRTATKRYLARRQRPLLLDQDTDLQAYVVGCLQEGISPEMIALRLKRYGKREGLHYINHESIYKWLYQPAQKKEKLYKLLTQQHAKRGRRKRIHRGEIKHRMSLAARPGHILKRSQAGHWEADLISFKRNTQHMLVLHERKTRYTALLKLENKTAAHTFQQLLSFMKQLPAHLRRTMTFDNGMEFAHHFKLKEALGVDTYFCDVYASWQKGSIENMNGRIRRDLPRKTNLHALSEADIEQIMLSHNFMPRKVLGAQSPIEALANESSHAIFFSFNHRVALHL